MKTKSKAGVAIDILFTAMLVINIVIMARKSGRYSNIAVIVMILTVQLSILTKKINSLYICKTIEIIGCSVASFMMRTWIINIPIVIIGVVREIAVLIAMSLGEELSSKEDCEIIIKIVNVLGIEHGKSGKIVKLFIASCIINIVIGIYTGKLAESLIMVVLLGFIFDIWNNLEIASIIMYCISIVSSLAFTISVLYGVRDTTMLQFSLINCLVATYSLLSRQSEAAIIVNTPVSEEGFKEGTENE